MRLGAIVTIVTLIVVPVTAATGADNDIWQLTASGKEPEARPKSVPAVSQPPRSPSTLVPCIGRGYRSYSYPAFGSCACGADCCFHPGRYYCGGKPYKRQWFKTWLRAHFGKGSMLDRDPCECRFPTTARTYVSSAPAAEPPITRPDQSGSLSNQSADLPEFRGPGDFRPFE